jgi:hypothetical protein
MSAKPKKVQIRLEKIFVFRLNNLLVYRRLDCRQDCLIFPKILATS